MGFWNLLLSFCPVSAIFSPGGPVGAGDEEDADPVTVQHRAGLVSHLEQQPLRAKLVHSPVYRHRGHVGGSSGLHAQALQNHQRHADGETSGMTSRGRLCDHWTRPNAVEWAACINLWWVIYGCANEVTQYSLKTLTGGFLKKENLWHDGLLAIIGLTSAQLA